MVQGCRCKLFILFKHLSLTVLVAAGGHTPKSPTVVRSLMGVMVGLADRTDDRFRGGTEKVVVAKSPFFQYLNPVLLPD